MKRRYLISAALAVALMPGVAMAQGRAAENAPDTPAGQDNRPDTPPGLEDRNDPPGIDNRPDTPGGQGSRPGSGPENPNAGETPPGPGSSNEDSALEAVRSGRAVPFDRVLSQAQSATGGELIDTRLLTVGGFLLYELRMLRPDGTVDRLYYYASTGNRVTTR